MTNAINQEFNEMGSHKINIQKIDGICTIDIYSHIHIHSYIYIYTHKVRRHNRGGKPHVQSNNNILWNKLKKKCAKAL